jgi:TatD DNase family protein
MISQDLFIKLGGINCIMMDSHCHIDDKQFDKDRDAVIDSAKKAGVGLIIDPATSFASNSRIQAICEKHKNYILPCAGLDPISCLKEEKIGELGAYLEKCVAVGEIGLDYYWSKEKERQLLNFARLLDLAKDYEKPVIVHAREAMDDTLDMLEKKRVERAVLHCFSGDRGQAKRAMDLGYYLSFATNICYRGSKSLIKDISLSSMIVETDSPYLHPSRAGRNEPKNVKFALDYIANLYEMPVEELEKIADKNTEKAFGL